MSALPPKADITSAQTNIRFVPIADVNARSLRSPNALDDVNEAFTTRTGIKVVTSYDASSALIKQIDGGAPADAFVSANLKSSTTRIFLQRKTIIHRKENPVRR